MTKVVVETAALADAIKKAERVAPASSEQSFDKTAGIFIEIDPDEQVMVVKATNLDIYSTEWVNVESIEGDKTTWRLPSKVFAMVCASLPIGSGKTVELVENNEGHHSQVILKSGRTTAKFNLLNSEFYPQWSAFDPDELVTVSDLGGRLSQVAWATDKASEPISGVNFDGEHVLATDRYRMARAPLAVPGIPEDESVTIPATILAGLLKQTGDVQLGFGGSQLFIMPDQHSQLRVIMYGLPYPNVKGAMGIELPETIKVRKTGLLEIMSRAVNFSGADRFPVLQCFLGSGEFAVMMSNDETGLLGDVLPIPGQAEHKRVKVMFTPKNIMEPLEKSPSEEVELHYNPENPKAPWRVDGGSGFQAWVMPRTEVQRQED